jgi:hypothetical protein
MGRHPDQKKHECVDETHVLSLRLTLAVLRLRTDTIFSPSKRITRITILDRDQQFAHHTLRQRELGFACLEVIAKNEAL